ncbi:hypothetical protein POTOM_049831 [Populus tomentosa]|uniref:Iron-binding zinc finger CDGSH type domain-containing protein n=1 Tax=Populus tomentosa TaxID=118781 RepID=A0A8X8CAU3_POPTO|nr:hypothetical protein POTOM_049831 [Populus tomentosa]
MRINHLTSTHFTGACVLHQITTTFQTPRINFTADPLSLTNQELEPENSQETLWERKATRLLIMSMTVASTSTAAGASFRYSKSRTGGVRPNIAAVRPRSLVVVRAEAQSINPEIRKSEEKVVDSVVVAELSKPLTAYCRCWRSGTFPLCDGSHVKHNKATGDNVGPLLLKKQKE